MVPRATLLKGMAIDSPPSLIPYSMFAFNWLLAMELSLTPIDYHLTNIAPSQHDVGALSKRRHLAGVLAVSYFFYPINFSSYKSRLGRFFPHLRKIIHNIYSNCMIQ